MTRLSVISCWKIRPFQPEIAAKAISLHLRADLSVSKCILVFVLRRALQIIPSFVQAFGGMMYTKTYICDWRDRNSDLAMLDRLIGRWLYEEAAPVLLPLQVTANFDWNGPLFQ